MHDFLTMMSSIKKMLRFTIIVISALRNFLHNQSMGVFQWCVWIGVHAWVPLEHAAVVVVMAVLTEIMKIRNLFVNPKQVLERKFLHRPGTKFYRICNTLASACIKLVHCSTTLCK